MGEGKQQEVAVKCIGILHHPKVPDSRDMAEAMARQLDEWGVNPWLGSAWDRGGLLAQVEKLDMLITLGGDGTVLRTARMVAPYGVPILGINLGRLGFLAEVIPAEWPARLRQVVEGAYWIEERMMIRAVTQDTRRREQSFEALNDVVVSHGVITRVVRLATYIDGGYLTTYVADGLIIATATGSTGYALSVGGPILPPELKNFLLVPIAPHLSFDRAIVLAEGATVTVRVAQGERAMLIVDGQFAGDLDSGEAVRVTASPHRARFVRVLDRSERYQTLMERLRPRRFRPED